MYFLLIHSDIFILNHIAEPIRIKSNEFSINNNEQCWISVFRSYTRGVDHVSLNRKCFQRDKNMFDWFKNANKLFGFGMKWFRCVRICIEKKNYKYINDSKRFSRYISYIYIGDSVYNKNRWIIAIRIKFNMNSYFL